MELTIRQREVLAFLRDDKEYGDLVYESGAGWWLGDQRTNGKLAFGLIRLCLISRDDDSDSFQRWGINESGRRALDGKPAYPKGDGTHTDDLSEILKLDAR